MVKPAHAAVGDVVRAWVANAGAEKVEQAKRIQLNRRGLLKGAGAAAMAASLARTGMSPDIASANSVDNLANVIYPPDVGQTDLTVYFKKTGHTLRGSMLDYWRANGSGTVYGLPISEPFGSDDGYYSQAFERAVFQYRPEFQDTEDPIIRLMPIGYSALQAHGADTTITTGRRVNGGADLNKSAWRPLSSGSSSATRAINNGEIYDDVTGHTVTARFYYWYMEHEGDFYLGSPLSQPTQRRGAVLQYFEGGLLSRLSDGTVELEPLVNDLAHNLRIDTTPVDKGDLPEYDESLFWTADNPNPIGDESSPGRKWVEVSLSQEQLWAHQGDASVMTTLVSTGLSPNVTLPGLFHVRLKFPSQTMNGFTDESGEVAGFGTDAPADDPSATPWEVKDVPNVMYFSVTAEALHGCYWHNNFGNPMSHGCVNLPLDVAAWMYGWAPLGTMVWIHD